MQNHRGATRRTKAGWTREGVLSWVLGAQVLPGDPQVPLWLRPWWTGLDGSVCKPDRTDGHKSGRERPRLPDLNHRREAKWCQEHPLCSPALRQDAGSRTAFPLPGSPVPRAVPLLEFIACVTLLNESYMENHLSSDSILFWKTQEPSKWETPCTCSARNRNHTSWNSRSVISKSFVFWTLPCVSALPASQCTK
eukprot:XP_028342454.1 uncharacterized protein LOC102995387 isoform X4 [Physeter catodon]